MFALQAGIVRTAIDVFVDDLATAVPKVIAGIVFLALAAVLIKAVYINN